MEPKKRVRSKMNVKTERIVVSSSSEVSTNSSSDYSDSPIKKFNRLLRSSVSRRWWVLRERSTLRDRGRSVSDAGLCSIMDQDREVCYLAVAGGAHAHRYHKSTSCTEVPTFALTSAGGSHAEEASDTSDAERPRRHHLRVPTPAFIGQSTGNFGAGGGGGCGAPRSAPATPLQLEPQPRTSKHDKQAIKPLSGSAPSVRGAGAGAGGDAKEGKQPSKARQKKFHRHFPQVGPEERVLNYYSCALVGDLLLQGHLYITKNYFAFYSNVFGYVTKLLIPTTSVLRITKEKVARIIPNAVGVCTRSERHVFGSLLSRDATYRLMTHVWKSARDPELLLPKQQELRTSEVELEASEYSPEDDSSSAAGDRLDAPRAAHTDNLIAPGGAAVLQPALLTGGAGAAGAGSASRGGRSRAHTVVLALAALLAVSAVYLACALYAANVARQEALGQMSGEELYGSLERWRARLHGRAAADLHAFLTTNLLLLAKVRQSLEALSGVILTDMSQNVPADAFS